MWQVAMTINTVIWSLLGIYLVYCTGIALIDGEWRQFVLVGLLWLFSNFTEVIFATQA